MKRWIWPGLLALFMTLGLAAAANAAPKGDWYLVNADSRLNFISVKKGHVAEVHHFGSLKGKIDGGGKAVITIDLSSVETYIGIRNERLKKFLFDIAKFPVATISTIVEPEQFENLGIGQHASTSTEVTLTMHGVSHKIETGLELFRLGKNKVLVIPTEMILLDASAYGMGPGIEKLKELAKLDSISTAVPVNFYFTFERQ